MLILNSKRKERKKSLKKVMIRLEHYNKLVPVLHSKKKN